MYHQYRASAEFRNWAKSRENMDYHPVDGVIYRNTGKPVKFYSQGPQQLSHVYAYRTYKAKQRARANRNRALALRRQRVIDLT